MNLTDKPDRVKCPCCDLLVDWWYLNVKELIGKDEAEWKEFFVESKWIRHLCLCKNIAHVSHIINQAIAKKELIRNQLDMNPQTRKFSKQRVEGIYRVEKKTDSYIREMQELLNTLTDLKKSSDPNKMYLDIRYDLITRHDAHIELLGCSPGVECECDLCQDKIF